ncbi:hypothetical protein D3C85_861150 [compost metagenome]
MAAKVFDQGEGDQRFEHGHLDRLPLSRTLALVQRHRDGVRQRQARHLVGKYGVHIGGRPAVAALQVRQPAHGLDDVVERRARGIRAILAEAHSGTMDEAGIARAQRCRVQPQPRQRRRTHIGDEDIGAVDQAQQAVAVCRRLGIQRHAVLVAIEVEVGGSHARVRGRGRRAEHVAFGRLDLDDLRAHVSQYLGGIGPHRHRGHVDDAHALERTRHYLASRCCLRARKGAMNRRGSSVVKAAPKASTLRSSPASTVDSLQ